MAAKKKPGRPKKPPPMERLLTMEEAADILRIDAGPRRSVKAWRQLQKLEKSTGLSLLIDVHGRGWLTTAALIEEAIPALRKKSARHENLIVEFQKLQKRLERLEVFFYSRA